MISLKFESVVEGGPEHLFVSDPLDVGLSLAFAHILVLALLDPLGHQLWVLKHDKLAVPDRQVSEAPTSHSRSVHQILFA